MVLLNGIPINDQSTTQGLHDFGVDFIQTVQQIEIYPGSSSSHFGTNAIGGLAESWVDSVPILVISGQTFGYQISNKARSFGLQGFNIIDNVKKIIFQMWQKC